MSERVHPAGPPPEIPPPSSKYIPPAISPPSSKDAPPAKPKPKPKPQPQPGTYVIQVPKDQIYRVPPPENARLSQSRRRASLRRRRGRCCCLLSWISAVLLLFLLSLAAAAGILFLVFRPKIPNYSIDNLSIKGFNLSLSSSPSISPEFDVTVRAANPNKKIGIFYRDGSSISVSFSAVKLCDGVWPTFYQGKRNVTVFETPLTGSGIRLSSAVQSELVSAQGRGRVPLEVDVRVPVRVKFGAVTSWTVTVKVRCDVTVDKLTADSRIVSKSCSVKVDI